jgi:hypothetical protein
VRKPRADGLDLARVLGILGQQRDAARDQDAGQIVHGGERHHHRGQALIAGRDTHHAFPGGQRTDEPAENHCRIVTIRQGIEHAGSPLAPAVTGVGTVAGKRDRAQRFQLPSRRFHEQADFPMAAVVAERDRLAVGGTQAAVRGKQQDLGAA